MEYRTTDRSTAHRNGVPHHRSKYLTPKWSTAPQRRRIAKTHASRAARPDLPARRSRGNVSGEILPLRERRRASPDGANGLATEDAGEEPAGYQREPTQQSVELVLAREQTEVVQDQIDHPETEQGHHQDRD